MFETIRRAAVATFTLRNFAWAVGSGLIVGLVKDRLYSGINKFLDEAFGVAVTGYLSGFLASPYAIPLTIFILIFGGVFLHAYFKGQRTSPEIGASVARGPDLLAWMARLLDLLTLPRKPQIYDISVLDFLRIGPTYGWNFENSGGWLYLDMQDALLDGAANGLITVWGRRNSHSLQSAIYTVPLIPIDPSYWRGNTPRIVLPMRMNGTMGTDNGDVSCIQGDDDGTRHWDLHLAKAEAARWMRTHGKRFQGLQQAASMLRNG